jgi:hypothetical protein
MGVRIGDVAKSMGLSDGVLTAKNNYLFRHIVGVFDEREGARYEMMIASIEQYGEECKVSGLEEEDREERE